jgi:hypothetical protein
MGGVAQTAKITPPEFEMDSAERHRRNLGRASEVVKSTSHRSHFTETVFMFLKRVIENHRRRFGDPVNLVAFTLRAFARSDRQVKPMASVDKMMAALFVIYNEEVAHLEVPQFLRGRDNSPPAESGADRPD